jgi:hypothetical protein
LFFSLNGLTGASATSERGRLTGKSRSLAAPVAHHRNRAAVQFREVTHNRQTETETVMFFACSNYRLGGNGRKRTAQIPPKSFPVIGDDDLNRPPRFVRAPQKPALRRGKFDRIRQKIQMICCSLCASQVIDSTVE